MPVFPPVTMNTLPVVGRQGERRVLEKNMKVGDVGGVGRMGRIERCFKRTFVESVGQNN